MVNCIGPKNDDYDKDRIISNARFDYKPELICYCKTEDDVKVAIARATLQTPFPGIRIRAGGHHHEGMCSALIRYCVTTPKFPPPAPRTHQ